MTTVATLCYVIKGGKILLMKKKTGFGAGFWNGPGGKVEENEDPEDAASRECFEEINIVPEAPKFVGELEFYYDEQQQEVNWRVLVFRADDYDGIERETEVAAPKWFSLARIPYGEMWPDDRIWMPLMLQGKKFKAKFYYKGKETILKHEIEELA